VLIRNSMRVAVLLAGAAGILATPFPALAAAPLHHDQAPGYFRLKVGDLEVTALLDGAATADFHWLQGDRAVLDGIEKATHEDPHMLDGADTGYVVNTGERLVLVDAGSGTWFGDPAFGHLVRNLRNAGYAPEEVDMVLVTHLHFDHIGGLTTQDGNRIFPNAEIYVAKEDNDFWLSPEVASKAPKEVQSFFAAAQAISAPYIKAGKWHTFTGSDQLLEGMRIVPLHGHTPGHTGYEFSSKGRKILFWGDTMHVQRAQLQHPELTVGFDIDPAEAYSTRKKLMAELVHEDVVIAGPHMLFPGFGRLHEDGGGYSWAPVAFTDQWVDK